MAMKSWNSQSFLVTLVIPGILHQMESCSIGVSSQEDVDNWRNWFGCFNISTLSDIHCPNIPYTEAPLSGPVLWGPISTPLSQLASPATTKSYPSKLYFLDESSLDNEEKINLALGLFELLSSGDQLPPDNLYIGIVDIETQEYWAKIEVTIVDG